MSIDPRDGGYKSRKFWFSMVALIAMFMFAFLAGKHIPEMAPMYGEFVGGVVGVSGLYLAGNVARQWVFKKSSKKVAPPANKNAD